MVSSKLLALGLLNSLSAFAAPVGGVAGASPNVTSPEAFAKRDFFYVGGSYYFNETLNGTLSVDQMYVEKLTPSCGVKQPYPLVFFHGQGPTGVNWLNTPDGRAGWATYFLNLGYEVYITETVGVGRSSSNDFADYPQAVGATVELAEAAFSAPEKFLLYPQAALHTQWPGNGTKGDPIFDQFYATLLPIPTNNTRLQYAMQVAGCALLDIIGPSYLISHSAGTVYPLLLSDKCPDLVIGAVNVEPYNTPFQIYIPETKTNDWGLSEIPITYDPPVVNPATDLQKVTVGTTTPERYSCILQADPPKKLVNIAKVPVLVILSEASIHQGWDYCVVDYMRQAGISVNYTQLADIGIHGNAHFMFIEKNSDQIAGVVESWLQNPTTGE